MSNVVVLVIDMQRDFVLEREGGPGDARKYFCFPAIQRILDHARRISWDVVHVHTVHETDDSLPPHLRARGVPLYCAAGSEGCQAVPGLVEPGETIIDKQSFSAFIDTTLGARLRNAEHVLVTGVAANCCIFLTAFDAGTRYGKQVFVPYDAVSASSLSAYEVGIKSMAVSAAAITSTEAVLGTEALSFEDHIPVDDAVRQGKLWYAAAQSSVEEIRKRLSVGDYTGAADQI
jgi:nicotinamidase-related amidase